MRFCSINTRCGGRDFRDASRARSNVSTSLRELQGGECARGSRARERRDHFESIKDVWEIFRIVSEERKRREIDPTLNVLAECVHEVSPIRRAMRNAGATGDHAGVFDAMTDCSKKSSHADGA